MFRERVKDEHKRIIDDIERFIDISMILETKYSLEYGFEYYFDECIKALDIYLLITKKEMLENIMNEGSIGISNELQSILYKIRDNKDNYKKLYQVSNLDECIDVINLIINYDNLKFINNLLNRNRDE